MVTVLYAYVVVLLRVAMGMGLWSKLLSKGVLTGAIEEMFWSMLVYCLIVGVW
jgi:hypothetical protein